MCFDFSTQFSEIFRVPKLIQRDIINIKSSSCILPCYFFRLLLKLSIIDTFSKSIQIENFMKILSVTAELFREEGRQMTKLAVHFRNFRTHLKKIYFKITNIFITLMKNNLSSMRRVCSCRIYQSFGGVCCMHLQDKYDSGRTTCKTYAYTRYTQTSNPVIIILIRVI
jgi:hypothetical protein